MTFLSRILKKFHYTDAGAWYFDIYYGIVLSNLCTTSTSDQLATNSSDSVWHNKLRGRWLKIKFNRLAELFIIEFLCE